MATSQGKRGCTLTIHPKLAPRHRNHSHSFMGLHFKRTLSAQLHGYKTAPRTMSVHSGHLNTQRKRKRMLKKRRGQRASYRNKCAFKLSASDVPLRTFCRLCRHQDVYRHEEAKTTKTKSKAAATRRLSLLVGDPELCVRRSTLRPGVLPRGPPDRHRVSRAEPPLMNCRLQSVGPS